MGNGVGMQVSSFRPAICHLLTVVIASCASAGPIQWMNDPEAAWKAARERLLPIYYYIPGSRDQEREAENWEDAHNKSHRNPKVEAMVSERFVPLRLQRGSQNDWFFDKVGIDKSRGRHGGVVTPELELLENLDSRELLRSKAVLDQLASGFRKFRRQLYDQKLGPVIRDPSSQPAALHSSLDLVRRYFIRKAEDDLLTLSKRELPVPTRKKLYETMAALSSARCATELLARAATDPVAARAMARCEPVAAPAIASGMNEQYDQRHIDAYHAVCDILDLRNRKSTAFWKTAHKDAKAREVKRVTELAQERAELWEQEIAPYR